MNSWWELGEGMGFQGDKLEVWRLACAFCGEKGNFKLAFHGEKKKPNSSKRLNFDVYQCTSCTGFVHVLWSASEFAFGLHGLYGYKILPWPIGKAEPSENWPDAVKRFWTQATNSLLGENWDAAAVMARSALQFGLRDKGAIGKNLKGEIEDVASKGILHPLMKEWSHEVRELGNDSAHPDPKAPPTEAQDARDIVRFLDFLLLYLYDLPKDISDYRERRNAAKPAPPVQTPGAGAPPLPITGKCVECGRDMAESKTVMMCSYCLGSVCDECAQGHYQRKGHPKTPEVV